MQAKTNKGADTKENKVTIGGQIHVIPGGESATSEIQSINVSVDKTFDWITTNGKKGALEIQVKQAINRALKAKSDELFIRYGSEKDKVSAEALIEKSNELSPEDSKVDYLLEKVDPKTTDTSIRNTTYKKEGDAELPPAKTTTVQGGK